MLLQVLNKHGNDVYATLYSMRTLAALCKVNPALAFPHKQDLADLIYRLLLPTSAPTTG